MVQSLGFVSILRPIYSYNLFEKEQLSPKKSVFSKNRYMHNN